jgi:hypothetical protein
MRTAREILSELQGISTSSVTPDEKILQSLKIIGDALDDSKFEGTVAGMIGAAHITSHYLENNRLHPSIENSQLNEAARVAAHSALQQAALTIMFELDKVKKTRAEKSLEKF